MSNEFIGARCNRSVALIESDCSAGLSLHRVLWQSETRKHGVATKLARDRFENKTGKNVDTVMNTHDSRRVHYSPDNRATVFTRVSRAIDSY